MPPSVVRVLPTLLLIAYLLLGGVYSLAAPIFEAPDELTHYPVVQHIAAGRGLPVQEPGVEQAWRQEGSQPPLYYLLAAGLTFWIDASDLPRLLWYNPHAYIGIPLADGNKNQVVHTSAESFPWHGATLAVHLVRLFSLTLGACTVALTRRLALVVFPGRPWLALTAAALVAFNPTFLFISASVNNDNLASALASLAILLMASALAKPSSPGDARWAAGLGLVLGLAAITKLSALALLPFAAATVAVRAWRSRAARVLLIEGGPIAAFLVGVAGWWYARNWMLYGDPTGLGIMLGLVGARPVTPDLGVLLSEFQGLRISFWALFGAFNVIAEEFVYRVLDAFMILAALGLLATWLRGRLPALLVLPAAWALAMAAALARWTQMTMATQGRLLFPAIQSIALLLAVGLAGLLPGRWGGRLPALAVAALATLAAVAPFRYIIPAYPGPDLIPAFDEAAIQHPTRITFAGSGELVGCTLDRESVRPGDELAVTLYWRSLQPFDRSCSLSLHVFGPGDELIAKRDSLPGRGAYPTTLWQPGQVFRDTYKLTISAKAAGPARLRLEAGLYDPVTLRNLPMVDGQGQAIHSPVLGYLKLERSAPPRDDFPSSSGYRLGDSIILAGHEVIAGAAPGTLRVTLYWQVTGRPTMDYAVFNHLLDETGSLLGQSDGDPRSGEYPTSFWQAGETIEDIYEVTGAAGTAQGTYRLAVGMYDRASGARLPVTDAAGRPAGDRVVIPVSLP